MDPEYFKYLSSWTILGRRVEERERAALRLNGRWQKRPKKDRQSGPGGAAGDNEDPRAPEFTTAADQQTKKKAELQSYI